MKLRLGWSFILVAIALLAMLALAVWGFTLAWRAAGNAPISLHGYIALGLGVGLSLLLGIGLMSLAFYSSRHGYDDDQGG